MAVSDKGAMDFHTEEAVYSGIIRSLHGEARELLNFIGF